MWTGTLISVFSQVSWLRCAYLRRRNYTSGLVDDSTVKSFCTIMDHCDASWLNELDVLGDHASADELLQALLGDDDSRHDAIAPSLVVSPRPAFHQDANASSSTGGPATNAQPPPPRKRQRRERERVHNYRPKEQIDQLRRAVADLENVLALARQRSQTGRMPTLPPADDTAKAEYSRNELMWMDAATRQYKYLREAHLLNEHLRSQVLSQMQVVKSLTRLVQRAQIGLPSEFVPRVLANTCSFTSCRIKREELLATTSQMYDSLEQVFASDAFNSTTEELSSSTTLRYEEYLIPPRASLASGCLRRYAPTSVADATKAMWLLDTPSEESRKTFEFDYVEIAADQQIIQGDIVVAGKADAKCVIVRRLRVWDSTRCSIVFASSLWPNPANESPWDRIGMDTKLWMDVRASQARDNDGPLTEVRCSIESSKLSDAPYRMTQVEATRLQEFVTKTVEFTINQLQSKLDSLLLSSSKREVFESNL